MSEHIEKATQSLLQFVDQIHNFARESAQANLRSVTAATKGWEESTQNACQLMRENVARLMGVGKTASEAKSVREVVDAQQAFMKDCVDLWMSGAGKISEINTQVTGARDMA